jgi:hypothetical protein
MIMRLSDLMHERIDSDPVQRAIWDREIGPRPVPTTLREQEQQILSANILPNQAERLFQQVHTEAESGDLCRGLGLKRGLDNFKMLIEIVVGLAAAIGLLFALIRSFTWVRDGFK